MSENEFLGADAAAVDTARSAEAVSQLSHAEPVLEVGDIVVSKFGNRWTVEACALTNQEPVYVLRNRPQETPDASGTVVSGVLPQWANRIERNGLRFWQRPTAKCECPAFANAKGPYPSGFCPDCKKWYPGIDRARAIALGHIQEAK